MAVMIRRERLVQRHYGFTHPSQLLLYAVLGLAGGRLVASRTVARLTD